MPPNCALKMVKMLLFCVNFMTISNANKKPIYFKMEEMNKLNCPPELTAE
jgi:hypothetical protein